jgi:hypothetical protein
MWPTEVRKNSLILVASAQLKSVLIFEDGIQSILPGTAAVVCWMTLYAQSSPSQ